MLDDFSGSGNVSSMDGLFGQCTFRQPCGIGGEFDDVV